MGLIEIIGTPLYQWEIGRKISVFAQEHTNINRVEFCHATDKVTLLVDPRT